MFHILQSYYAGQMVCSSYYSTEVTVRNLCYMKGCFEALAHEFFYLVSFRFNVGRISIALVAAGLQSHCLLVSAILQMSLNFA